jgi:DNA-binding NtrC family response regulator
MAYSLLIVDDDVQVLESLSQLLALEGYVIHRAGSVSQALEGVAQQRPEAVICDHELTDGTALDFLSALRGRGDTTPVIVLTGQATYDLAVRAIKSGAENFLTKPVHGDVLFVTLERLFTQRREARKRAAARRGASKAIEPFIGTSSAVRALEELAHAVLQSQAPVLILGETGTGKSVLARWLHERGPRAEEAFVDLNCAGLSKELAESELFGHRRGAFTGAAVDKGGLLELAHEGTLFLDEIGDLELSVQPKLLKVLEDKVYRRLGEVQTRVADVRLISATHRNLVEMAQENSFRNDLLFRINTVMFELPPLRSRSEDIVPLAEHILEQVSAEQGKPGVRLSPRVGAALEAYPWPGNVRELRNTLERALIFCRGDVLELDALRLAPVVPSAAPAAAEPASTSAALSLEELERRHIAQVLADAGGKVDVTAQRLGIPRSSLYAKIKRYGLGVR